jgi:hypothetical protein
MTVLIDRRFLILEQMFSLLNALNIGLTGGETVANIPAGNIVHNRDELPGEKVPGLILLDADETKDPRFPQNPGRQGPSGPGMMRMTPEIYVVLDVRKPANLNVGEDLLLARAAIMASILGDTTLQSLVGAGGSIVYDGCYTDLARNRQMRGQMGLSFTFGYPFVPGEFKAV